MTQQTQWAIGIIGGCLLAIGMFLLGLLVSILGAYNALQMRATDEKIEMIQDDVTEVKGDVKLLEQAVGQTTEAISGLAKGQEFLLGGNAR